MFTRFTLRPRIDHIFSAAFVDTLSDRMNGCSTGGVPALLRIGISSNKDDTEVSIDTDCG
jgi:hypothetical protein